MATWFEDDRGVEWEVWEVRARQPLRGDAPPPRRARRADGAAAWLCFASATQRRRLERYPGWWQALPPAALAALCDTARPEPLPELLEVTTRPPREL